MYGETFKGRHTAQTTRTLIIKVMRKTEIYSVINKTITSKWPQQWDHPPCGTYKGRAYYHLQRNVKKDVVMYSSNRQHDKVYTRLRFGHSRQGFHCRWEKEGICRQCDDPII